MCVSMKPGKKKLVGLVVSIVTLCGRSSGWKPKVVRASSGVTTCHAVFVIVVPETRTAPLRMDKVFVSGVDMKRPRYIFWVPSVAMMVVGGSLAVY